MIVNKIGLSEILRADPWLDPDSVTCHVGSSQWLARVYYGEVVGPSSTLVFGKFDWCHRIRWREREGERVRELLSVWSSPWASCGGGQWRIHVASWGTMFPSQQVIVSLPSLTFSIKAQGASRFLYFFFGDCKLFVVMDSFFIPLFSFISIFLNM